MINTTKYSINTTSPHIHWGKKTPPTVHLWHSYSVWLIIPQFDNVCK